MTDHMFNEPGPCSIWGLAWGHIYNVKTSVKIFPLFKNLKYTSKTQNEVQ